jgi:hypothetical protein
MKIVIFFCKHSNKVRVEGLEPPSLAAPDPKSGVSTNFTTPAFLLLFCKSGAKILLSRKHENKIKNNSQKIFKT